MNKNEESHHIEDVGKILLQVQNDMNQLRSQLQTIDGKDVTKISESLDNILEKAEQDIKTKTHLVLNGVVNDTIKTLPCVEQYNYEKSENNYQIYNTNNNYNTYKSIPIDESRLRNKVNYARRLDHITNPFCETGRSYLKESFGVPIKLKRDLVINEQNKKLTQAKNSRNKLNKGKESLRNSIKINRNNILPPSNKGNINLVEKGMFNLINTGRVPQYADLSSVFIDGEDPPLQSGKAITHDWNEQFTKPLTFAQPFTCELPTIKLDLNEATKSQTKKTFYDTQQRREKNKKKEVTKINIVVDEKVKNPNVFIFYIIG